MRIIYYVCLAGTVLWMSSCAGPQPLFDIEVGDREVPTSVTFIDRTIEEVDSIKWMFGDGNTASDSIVSHEYLMSGRYMVTLEAMKGGKDGKLQKEIILDPPKNCLVLMETTMGDMLIELYDATPKHRDNFVKLAEEGFLDSLLFHRVIDGFMIQGGDPNSKNANADTRLGSGGPGYQIDAEFVDTLVHIKGALAAARQGDQVNPQRKSSGSQFYIVQGRKMEVQQLKSIAARQGKEYSQKAIQQYVSLGGTPQLDWSYTVFGHVVKGMDIIDMIARVRTDRSDRPIDDVRILDVKVIK